jgi:hypothetical protein
MFNKKPQITILAILISLAAASPLVQARTVAQVIIEEDGMSMEPERMPIERCKYFKPNEEQVTHYFNYAYPIEADFATLERYTPCYARGTVTFTDHFSGEWILYSSGTASFNFRRGDFITFFYQYNDWYDPTNGEYGPRWEKE